MGRFLLKNATIVTGASSKKGALGIDGDRISGIWYDGEEAGHGHGSSWPVCPDPHHGSRADFPPRLPEPSDPGQAHPTIIDLEGKVLMAGGIDAHVHFREPGMTRKADLGSESAAALLGGVTSFIDMPNTSPPTVSMEALEEKLARASASSMANYGFHLGATNDNAALIKGYISSGLGGRFAGIKVFMGSSTGNMLVDRETTLRELFQVKGKPILVHSEDEGIIKANLEAAKAHYGEGIPFRSHPGIRSREACIKSTRKALDMAIEYGTALHILHVTTAEEIGMIREAKERNPLITAETSANYLWFCDEDYDRLGGRVKCNPAIKAKSDQEALRQAFAEGTIDTIGSDHAPHLLAEKARPYLECPSGMPSIQYSLPAMLTIASRCGIPLTRIAGACSEKAAEIFGIKGRGRLEVGKYADLVVIGMDREYPVRGSASKCGWSPYEGEMLRGAVEMAWLNGVPVVSNGKLCTGKGLSRPRPLQFLSTAGS